MEHWNQVSWWHGGMIVAGRQSFLLESYRFEIHVVWIPEQKCGRHVLNNNEATACPLTLTEFTLSCFKESSNTLFQLSCLQFPSDFFFLFYFASIDESSASIWRILQCYYRAVHKAELWLGQLDHIPLELSIKCRLVSSAVPCWVKHPF